MLEVSLVGMEVILRGAGMMAAGSCRTARMRVLSDADTRFIRCGLTCLTMRVGHDHHGDAVLVLRLGQCHYAIFGLGWRGNGDKNCQEKLPLFSCRFVINFHKWECLQRRRTSGCLNPACSSSGRGRCSQPDSRLLAAGCRQKSGQRSAGLS